MADIPLTDAQIIWDREADRRDRPLLKVVGGGVKDDDRYSSSWGFCNQDFNDANPDRKLQVLLTKSIYLTLTEGFPAKEVHDALMVIPEYRAEMIRGSVIPPEEEAEY